MENSDILLENEQLRAIRQILVTTAEDEDPDIELLPDIASLHLGGGAGSHSEGDVRLRDEDSNVRIHYSAGNGRDDFATTRAFVDGTTGNLLLGANGVENEDVRILPEWASMTLGGGDGSNSDGDVKLNDRESKTRMHLDGGGGGPADAPTNLYVDASTASIHARPQPVSEDASHTHPLLYLFNDWVPDGSHWTDEGFPAERPIIAHSETWDRNGLVWHDGNYVFQALHVEDTGSDAVGDVGSDASGGGGGSDASGGGGSDASGGSGFDAPGVGGGFDVPADFDASVGSSPGGWNVKRKRVLTVEMSDERVGVNTDSPEHALHVEGKAHATEHTIPSDARYKADVEGIDGPDALDAVQRLRGVTFEWDEDAPHAGVADDDRHLGFVAQEVEDVLPESVSRDEDGYRSMTRDAVTPVLVEAVTDQQEQLDEQRSVVEEQRAVIEEQRETIARQREALADLEERVARLEAGDETGGGSDGTDGASGV